MNMLKFEVSEYQNISVSYQIMRYKPQPTSDIHSRDDAKYVSDQFNIM